MYNILNVKNSKGFIMSMFLNGISGLSWGAGASAIDPASYTALTEGLVDPRFRCEDFVQSSDNSLENLENLRCTTEANDLPTLYLTQANALIEKGELSQAHKMLNFGKQFAETVEGKALSIFLAEYTLARAKIYNGLSKWKKTISLMEKLKSYNWEGNEYIHLQLVELRKVAAIQIGKEQTAAAKELSDVGRHDEALVHASSAVSVLKEFASDSTEYMAAIKLQAEIFTACGAAAHAQVAPGK
ncbi:MAG: hypothetical protein P0S96_05015 [Simkaniaceae bacterium]|nr:hypothetical protein [Candidatus Sacchlamyda saccharinae]